MSDPFEEVLGPLRQLRRRIEAELNRHGLTAATVAYMPADRLDGPHEIQIIAMLKPEEPTAIDDGFEEVIRGAAEAEHRQRYEQARQQLQQSLGDEGFL